MDGPSPPQKADRQTTTPFLLKLFYRTSAFHPLLDFTPTSHPLQYLQIYTWPSCTLRELTYLLTAALPNLLPNPAAGTRITFRLVYPDTRPASYPRVDRDGDPPIGRFLGKELGSVVVGSAPRPLSPENRSHSAAASERENTQAENGNGEDAEHPGDESEAVSALSLSELDGEPEKTLADVRFIIGDYVCCAILPLQSDGRVAPAPSIPGVTVRANSYATTGMPPRGAPSVLGPGRGEYETDINGAGDGGYGRRGPGSGRYGRGNAGARFPSGEWRRGERLPDGSGLDRGYRGRGIGRG